MKFDDAVAVRRYLSTTYPKSKGKTLAGWTTSDISMAIGVYEDGDLVQGLIILNDIRINKWIILDSLPADLAVRNYIEYREELDEAIKLFDLLESIEDEDSDEELFFTDLD